MPRLAKGTKLKLYRQYAEDEGIKNYLSELTIEIFYNLQKLDTLYRVSGRTTPEFISTFLSKKKEGRFDNKLILQLKDKLKLLSLNESKSGFKESETLIQNTSTHVLNFNEIITRPTWIVAYERYFTVRAKVVECYDSLIKAGFIPENSTPLCIPKKGDFVEIE
ncbi:MAG: hypothetical protein IPJ66_06175 [Bacteroidetes bacterium]|nr:hypothetical protein [Bacteroidota bacterium]